MPKWIPLLLLALFGCSAPAASSEPSVAPSETPAPVTKVGGAYSYPDGVKVQITDTKAGKMASDYGDEFALGKPVTFVTVKVTNGSPATLDATLITLNVTVGSEGDDVPTMKGADFKPGISTPILPGRSDAQLFAVASTKLERPTYTVNVAADHEPAVFTG